MNKYSKFYYRTRGKVTRFWDHQVRFRLFPRQKWLRKVIPNHFQDVDVLFENILFAGLIFFWEEDDGEPSLRLQYEYVADGEEDADKEMYEINKKIYDDLSEAYRWAKTDRKALTDRLTSQTLSAYYNNTSYDDAIKLESEIIEKDTQYMSTIVKYRKHLWT